jgi:hypothetical protein
MRIDERFYLNHLIISKARLRSVLLRVVFLDALKG